jgi:hypothetical protein
VTLDTWSQRFRQSVEAKRIREVRASQARGRSTAQLRPIAPDDVIGEMPLKELSDPAMADLHREALRVAMARVVSFYSCDLEFGVNQCQSPIECSMFYALWIAAWDYEDGIGIRIPAISPDVVIGGYGLGVDSFVLEMTSQARVSRYRVDFLLTHGDGPDNRQPLVLECDGHVYHERTKEQAERDRARDRELQSLGYPVFRYTGSEIWDDVLKHAHEALDFFYR